MTLAHIAPTLLDGSHVLAFLVGAAVCGVVARLVVLYAEREAERSDDLAPIPFAGLPPASAHSQHTHYDLAATMKRRQPGRIAATPEPPKLALYDVEAEG